MDIKTVNNMHNNNYIIIYIRIILHNNYNIRNNNYYYHNIKSERVLWYTKEKSPAEAKEAFVANRGKESS